MKKLLLVLLLFALLSPSAFAVQTDSNFDYGAIIGCAGAHYGEIYTLVGRVVQVEEYHRSSDDKIVEEYTTLAVDDNPDQIVCLHYTRPKNQFPMDFDSIVVVLAYVDGVRRTGKEIVPLLESKSDPIIIEEPQGQE